MSSESRMEENRSYRRANSLRSLDRVHVGSSLFDDEGLAQSNSGDEHVRPEYFNLSL
jgi:hypothetical protein